MRASPSLTGSNVSGKRGVSIQKADANSNHSLVLVEFPRLLKKLLAEKRVVGDYGSFVEETGVSAIFGLPAASSFSLSSALRATAFAGSTK